MLTAGVRTVARRYARAVLETALLAKENADREATRVGEALVEVRSVLEGSADLARALGNPAIPTAARQKVAAAVFAGAPPLVERLVSLLVERDRVGIVGAIEEAYAEAWNERRGVVRAEVESAVPLDTAQSEALSGALGKATGKQVELRSRVDPAVLGGLQVFLAGRTFDGTVRSQLEAMRRTLQGIG